MQLKRLLFLFILLLLPLTCFADSAVVNIKGHTLITGKATITAQPLVKTYDLMQIEGVQMQIEGEDMQL